METLLNIDVRPLPTDRAAIVQLGAERVRVYREGGMCFQVHVPGVGWVVNDEEPDRELEESAYALRAWFVRF